MVGPPGPAPCRGALLLLHGGSGSWLHWFRTIPVLEQHHSVWVPDLPGMGDSALPDEPYEAEPYAEINAYAQDVPARDIGAGLSDAQLNQLKSMLDDKDLWKLSDELARFFAAFDALGLDVDAIHAHARPRLHGVEVLRDIPYAPVLTVMVRHWLVSGSKRNT